MKTSIVYCGVLTRSTIVVMLAGCSPSLPKPAFGPVPDDALFAVPFPPPPARVETISPRTRPGDVWIDGQWDWDGKDYRWQDGRWMTPPKGAYFTRYKLVYKPDNRLYFARAAWRDAGGKRLDLWPSMEVCPREGAAKSQ